MGADYVSGEFDIPEGAALVDDTKKTTLPWLHVFSRWQQVILSARQSGPTASRPTTGLWIGRRYWDTDLAAPVWVQSVKPTVWATAGGGGGGTGTVTSVSVVSANGFAGTVATASTTPAITLKTTITGLLKGNGTAISAAAAGTDYVAPTTTVNGHALSANVTVTASDVGLGSVTNDAQTKAAIVPNTAPAAGNLLVGNAGGTAYAPVASSGDVTVSSAGAFTIGAAKVTYAKMQNVSATSRILGRVTAGAGSPEELTLTQALDFVGSAANGDILSRQAGTWNRLAIGTTGQVLTVVSGVPAWGSNELQLANVTLGVGGTSLASGTITACKFLRIVIYLSGYAGSDTASLQFNGAAGIAYRYRWLTSAAGGTTDAAGLIAASTDRIKIAAANTTNSRIVECVISNDPANTEKLVKFIGSLFGTGSAGTQATEDRGNGAWISGASTSITSVSLVSSSNMNAGTQMTIYGWN